MIWEFKVYITDKSHSKYAPEICQLIEESAKQRGTGIAKRDVNYIIRKIEEGKAVICLRYDNRLSGFCYIETWSNANYVANSGLIVHPDFRKHGLAKMIKRKAFNLSRKLYPKAKLFGLTTSLAVMKINSDLGYEPVTFSELSQDDQFWQGCSSCVNYDILNRMKRVHCLCTGMMFDPAQKGVNGASIRNKGLKIYERWLQFKRFVLLSRFKKDNSNS
ncbi:MAG TPA: GNAT family N-acetyltransferase [Cyclobacteriaceae bacterium]|nr:GNAT family N-acetyltransferase [Cyclobacteriaceae bacterium]